MHKCFLNLAAYNVTVAYEDYEGFYQFVLYSILIFNGRPLRPVIAQTTEAMLYIVQVFNLFQK